MQLPVATGHTIVQPPSSATAAKGGVTKEGQQQMGQQSRDSRRNKKKREGKEKGKDSSGKGWKQSQKQKGQSDWARRGRNPLTL